MNPDAKQLLKSLVEKNFQGNWRELVEYIEKLEEEEKKDIHQKISSSKKVHISFENVIKTYKVGNTEVKALKGVNLKIYQGEFVAITGPSGSGKSTILQILGGLDKPNSGKIVVDDKDINKLNDKELSKYRNSTIGFVFQSFYLQPYLDVLKNVQMPLFFRKMPKSIRIEHAKEAVIAVGLEDRMNHLPKQLSGGQMQRVGIARALANEPRIVLADEPTANLDKENTKDIVALLKKINKAYGITIVVVTHNDAVAKEADRIIKLDDGNIK